VGLTVGTLAFQVAALAEIAYLGVHLARRVPVGETVS
jgi:hypothetical protein